MVMKMVMCRGEENGDGGAGEEKMVMEVPGKRRW